MFLKKCGNYILFNTRVKIINLLAAVRLQKAITRDHSNQLDHLQKENDEYTDN